jgi:hypothetical protein
LGQPAEFEQRLNRSVRKDWIVDVRSAGSSERVVKYLARYVQRVAISNGPEPTDQPRETENTRRQCPVCGRGTMVIVKALQPTMDKSFERFLTLARSPPLPRSA